MAYDASIDHRGATLDLTEHGFPVFDQGVDAKAASRLLSKVKATRAFSPDLFLSEAEFDADPQYTGVNPRPGRNLLDTFASDLDFVEKDPAIVAPLTDLLGADYACLNRKFVCGVPRTWLPDWLVARIEGNPVNNLGA